MIRAYFVNSAGTCVCVCVALSTSRRLDEGASAVTAVEETVARVFSDLKLEFGTKEASLSVLFERIEGVEERYLRDEAARRLLSLLSLLPHGALKMSHDLEGLVSGVHVKAHGSFTDGILI